MIRRNVLRLSLALCSISFAVDAQGFDYTAAERLFHEPVTVSVSGKPERTSDVPANMEIVTADDIRRSGADNIPDILQFVSGLNVRRYGWQSAAVGIRGYNTALNPRVLVLVDGRQVYQDDYGFTPWALIPVPLASIRQIEIIKGPAAALYGFNAVSGVINIVTYDPLHDNRNAAQIKAGTQSSLYAEGVATAQSVDTWGVRLSANRRQSDALGQGDSANTSIDPQTTTAAIDTAYRIAPGIEWRLSGSAATSDAPYYPDIGYYVPLSNDNHSIRTAFSADTDYGLFTFDAYRNDAEINMSILGNTTLLDWQQDITVFKLGHLLRAGNRNTFRLGLEYRRNAAKSPRTFSGKIESRIVSGSLMWDWRISPRWSLTNAVRIDSLSLHHEGPQFVVPTQGPLFEDTDTVKPSFNSGLVFQASDYDTFRLTAARAYQLPSLLDFGFVFEVPGVVVTGDPHLQPARVTHYEIDYERSVPALASKLELAAFAQYTDTTVGSPFGSGYGLAPGPSILFQARNFDDSHELGAELEFSGQAAGYRWNASYVLTSVEDDTPAAVLDNAPSVSYARQTPLSTIILGAGKSWQQWSFDARARWQSRYRDTAFDPARNAISTVDIDGYLTLGARAAYQLTPELSVSLNAQQLNAAEQTATAGRPLERRVDLGLAVNF